VTCGEGSREVPLERRHLALHQGHLSALNAWDEEVIDANTIQALSLTASATRSGSGRSRRRRRDNGNLLPAHRDDQARELEAFYQAGGPLTV